MNSTNEKPNLNDWTLPAEIDAVIRRVAKDAPQNTPVVDVKVRYVIEAAHRRELQLAMDRAAKGAGEAYIIRNPEASNLKLRPNNCVYKPNPTKHNVVIPGIMDKLLKPDWATKTQAFIANSVAIETGAVVNKNVWRSPLTLWTLKNFKRRLSNSMLRELDVNLTHCKTLADIKASIKAATVAADSNQIVTVKLQFTSTHLVIGRASYPLTERNGTKAYKVRVDGKQRWLDVDALQFLINKSADKV